MTVTYFVPLSFALEFPRLRFGSAEIRSFTKAELSVAWDVSRLLGHGPAFVPDVDALCHFQYLVVRGDTQEGRWTASVEFTFPLDLSPDKLDRVDVYKRRFPPIVDRAIFCLLLQSIQDAFFYNID